MAVKYKDVRVREETHGIAKRLAKKRDQSLVAYFHRLVKSDLSSVEDDAYREKLQKRVDKKGAK